MDITFLTQFRRDLKHLRWSPILKIGAKVPNRVLKVGVLYSHTALYFNLYLYFK